MHRNCKQYYTTERQEDELKQHHQTNIAAKEPAARADIQRLAKGSAATDRAKSRTAGSRGARRMARGRAACGTAKSRKMGEAAKRFKGSRAAENRKTQSETQIIRKRRHFSHHADNRHVGCGVYRLVLLVDHPHGL
jgi:hypothetical protein